MNTYYMDNSAMVYESRLVVIGETAFKTMKNDPTRTDWQHHWISGEFQNLNEAKAYFAKEWGKEINKMKKIIGTCGKNERNVVYWFEGDRISIPSVNVMFVTYTRDRDEALDICRRNLLNFVEC